MTLPSSELLTGLFFIGFWVCHIKQYYLIGLVCQFVMVIVNVHVLMHRITVDSLVSMVPIGLVLGAIMFLISLGVTTKNPLQEIRYFLKNISKQKCSDVIMKNIPIQLKTAIWEELFWRGLLQGIILIYTPSPIAIILTALLFWAAHFHRFKNAPIRALEMFGFSLCLGGIYEMSYGIFLCVIIHFVRNMMIILYREQVLLKGEQTS